MKAKKIINIVVGVLLVAFIGSSVFLFIKYRNSEKEYDDLLKRKNELAIEYNSLLEEKKQLKADYESLTTSNEQLQSDYESLQSDYDTLIADYTELELLYIEETEVTYETPTDLSEYDSDVSYDDLARTPDDYAGKAICMEGEVVQLLEGDGANDLRVAIDGDYEEMVYFTYDPNVIEVRVLEGDDITMYGNYYGIYSYESAIGTTVSIPLIIGTYIEID